jgi:hypothetical protein
MKQPPRLIIGQKYLVPNEHGVEAGGTLERATVAEQEGLIYGVYLLDNGQRIIATNAITDAELNAYRADPNSFFAPPTQG